MRDNILDTLMFLATVVAVLFPNISNVIMLLVFWGYCFGRFVSIKIERIENEEKS